MFVQTKQVLTFCKVNIKLEVSGTIDDSDKWNGWEITSACINPKFFCSQMMLHYGYM